MNELKTHPRTGTERIEFLFERRALLGKIGVVAFALSLLTACLWPKTYTSSASIMPPGNSSMGAAMFAALAGRGTGGLSGLGSLAGSFLGLNSSSAIYVELLRSGTINGEIVDRFDLQKVYHKRYRADTLKALARHVHIQDDKKSEVITLVVEDHDPQRACDIAAAYLDGLNRLLNRTSTSSARQERIFVERRLFQARHDLEQAQLALSEFSSTHGTVDLKEQARAEVTSGSTLQAQILVEESNITSMRQIYGDGNIRLRAAEARLSALRAQLKKIEGSSAPLPDNSTDPPSDIAPSLRQLPRLAVPFADRYRDVQIQEKLFELLTEQFEMARISEAKDVPVLKVIDAPAVAEKKSFPPRALMTLALWLGVMSLVCLGLLLLDYVQEHEQDARILRMHRIAGSLIPSMGAAMKDQIQNVFYGVLDYVAFPAVMLLVAPLLLRKLGADGYGLWSVMAALVSATSILASGFGDAAIKHVSQYRAKDRSAVVVTVRTLFMVSCVLAALFVLPIIVASPWIAMRVAHGNSLLRMDCRYSLLLVSVLIVQRSIESAFISTQRAYERYGAAVRISIFARIGSLVAATLMASQFPRVWCVLLITALCNVGATVLQHRRVRELLGMQQLRPLWNANAMMLLFQFGKYSWLLALSGVVFGQLDRLFLGMWLGAPVIAAYAICAQIAQPIYGISAAGLHVLFPYLSHRAASGSSATLRRSIAIAAAANICFAIAAGFALQTVGLRFLALLGRSGLNGDSRHLLAMLVWSSSLLAISVVPTYALYALDRIQLVTIANVVGAFACIVCMAILGLHFGVIGIASARLAYGFVCILLYLPLWHALKHRTCPTQALRAVCEEV